MSEQEHIALAQRYYAEVVNGGDLTKVDELFSPAYITHHNDPASLPHGPEGVRQFVAMTRAAFSDFQLTVRDLFCAGRQSGGALDNGRYAYRSVFWPAGNEPAGRLGWRRNYANGGGGRIAEDWYNFDQLSLLMQLGAIPAPQ